MNPEALVKKQDQSCIKGPWWVDDEKIQKERQFVEQMGQLTVPQFLKAIRDQKQEEFKRKRLQSYLNDQYEGPRQSFWIYGDSGTGKKTYALKFAPFIKKLNKQWNGYADETDVVLNNSHGFSKQWGDDYGKLSAEIRCGPTKINYHRLWVTSKYSIKEIFGKDEMVYQGMKWRYKEIKFHNEKIDQNGATWELMP
ncbi:hypothetical protein pb186bvf_006038 [Paramecium bursaria]